MTGIELEISTRSGDDGLELAGVVGVGSTSPPSPSLSMAESSTNKNFLLLGSTTKKNLLESERKRKKEEKKRRTYSYRCSFGKFAKSLERRGRSRGSLRFALPRLLPLRSRDLANFPNEHRY